MVAGFHRSISFPGSPLRKARPVSEKSYHVRSISLPCRSHPLVSHLKEEIRSVNSWQSTQAESDSASASASSAWLCDGLARLELLHTSLNDLLELPQNQESLRTAAGSEWTDRFLDDFLRFADVHGSFRSEIVAMNEHQSEAQIAIRRNDSAKLGSSIRSMKKTEKQLVKLASSLREIPKSSQMATRFVKGFEEAKLAGVIREVINVTVAASAAVFLGIAAVSSATSAAMSASSSSSTAKGLWMQLKKKKDEECGGDAMERVEELEECIGAVESRCERVFRCFVNTRVSLLTILAPSL